MSISRGLTKAAKAAKKQSRGLTGNRNSQGDFIPEDIQTKGVQEAVAPDIQNYIDDVKSQIDEIDAQITELEKLPHEPLVPYDPDNPGPGQQIVNLKSDKLDLLEETITKLEEEGIEVPDALLQEASIIGNEKARALSMNNATGQPRYADPDLQNYIDDVRRELDAIDASREKLSPNDYEGHMKYLEEKEGFIKDVIQELEDNNVAVPKELTRELDINALEQKRVNDSLGPEWANDNANEEPYDIDMTDEEKGIRYAQPARRGYGMDDESLY